ncbi:MAG: hypothetical protein OEN56_00615 [Gemmatimonadota bacterium]|nr:hypothetical protein [Gemmatimonadota bacterium]MDH3424966.1 hypothetical protein [Gemmatimonadota bacterium]
MPVRCIRYRSGYKYQLRGEYVDWVAIRPERAIETEYVCLEEDGRVTLKGGYAWDGPSGPSIDTQTFMRGSLVHDALYQLMRLGELDAERWRDTTDRELQRMCRDDGMFWLRSVWVYFAVRWFGEPFASPAASKQVETAPRGCEP